MDQDNNTSDRTNLQQAHDYVAFGLVVISATIATVELVRLGRDLVRAGVEKRRELKDAKKND